MAKAGYEVIGGHIVTETRLNEAGNNIEDVHVIPYQITTGPAAGARRSVKVPHSMYSAENAKAMIEDDVNTTHDVASLSQKL